MIVYLNGQWLDRDEAKISPEDRGFMFSDGVYEVVRYYFGRPLAIQMHVDRMKFGLNELRISLPDDFDLARMSDELVERNQMEDAAAYWQVTRGVAPRDFNFPTPGTPATIYAIAYPAQPIQNDSPVPTLKAITTPDVRWMRCEIKAISLLPNVLASQEAADAGCDCAILIRSHQVTEATSRSILIVENDTLYTHPLDGTILDSITRRIALEMARSNGIAVTEDPFDVSRMYDADEVIAVGSSTEIAAVIEIDQHAIKDAKPGRITRRLHGLYRDYIFENCGKTGISNH